MRHPERLRLAHLPTPIVPLPRLAPRLGVKRLWLWRDDLTGSIESGNKIRKLEFLAAAAVHQGATRLVTCGGPQSNHARATVYVARRLGLAASLVIREPRTGFDRNAPPTGNLLLSRIGGADVSIVPFAEYKAAGSSYTPFLEAEAERSRVRGDVPYVIAEGGSSPEGAFGYIHAVEEMLSTWRQLGTGKPHPSALFCAVGSGGTLAGLHLGYEQQRLPVESVHAVNVCDSAPYFQTRTSALMAETAQKYGLAYQPRQLSIFDGHFGTGYAEVKDSDFHFYADVARTEGFLLDPVYTGKAFQGMCAEIAKDPRRFGDDVMFLMSGGMFGTFAYADGYARALGPL